MSETTTARRGKALLYELGLGHGCVGVRLQTSVRRQITSECGEWAISLFIDGY